ncbi:MAG: putative molybdenum carrier protein [Deltaproteobacteria bacterium]|nr:putative molybdenum carrier protein [Deltaproteobacteria bacterium]
MAERLRELEAYKVKKIVSGCQTGVDRAALEIAMEFGIPVGGWCPKGRMAEDGPIDAKYPLQETNSTDYAIRTMLNVRDSHGSLVLTKGIPTGGTALTIKRAKGFDKDYLIVDLGKECDAANIKEWLFGNLIDTLNIAGPRESSFPGIYDQTTLFLRRLFEYMPFKK